MLWIVPLCCRSSHLVVCRSIIWLENLRTLTTRAQPLFRDLSSVLAVQVCVVPLNSSATFCSCSLTYAATESPSWLLTTPTSFPVTLNVRLKIAGKFLVKLEANYEASFLSQKYACLHHSMLITHSAIWLVLLNLQMTPPGPMWQCHSECKNCSRVCITRVLITIFTTLQWHYS